ncbi:TolC family protein [Marinibaculum pumilum]|uniref:TolC family protein n=1 Tax=Marinibaculum pumilum TaxID=1766165 RepID=A0ABV7L860_9PROT
MSLADAVLLLLRNNRSIRSAYLNRITAKYSLILQEDRFVPTGSITVGPQFSRNRDTSDTISNTTTWQVNPSVTWNTPLGGSFTFNWSNTGTSANGVNSYASNPSFSLTLPLLQGGGIDVNRIPILQARITNRNATWGLRSTLISQITSVIQNYRSLIQQSENVKIQQQALERARQQVAVNQALIDAGRMAAQDIVQSNFSLAQNEISLSQARNSLDNARLTLLNQLDLPEDVEIVPTESLDTPAVTLDVDRLFQIALDSNPGYRQAQLSLENARLSLESAENNYLWSLNITASGSYTGTADSTFVPRGAGYQTQDNETIGLTLTIPLNDQQRDQTLVSARVGMRQQQLALEDNRQSLRTDILNAVRNVEILYRQLQQSRVALELARQQLETERVKLLNGRSTNFQVLTYENSYVQAQVSELQARISYLNALTTLDQSLGQTLDTWRVEVPFQTGPLDLDRP